jgi:putative membrane protein
MLNVMADCRDGFMHWSTGGWIWMGIMMLVGLVALIVIVYLIFKGVASAEPSKSYPFPTSHGETPLEIAQRRYASGEITKEGFEQIKRDLSG